MDEEIQKILGDKTLTDVDKRKKISALKREYAKKSKDETKLQAAGKLTAGKLTAGKLTAGKLTAGKTAQTSKLGAVKGATQTTNTQSTDTQSTSLNNNWLSEDDKNGALSNIKLFIDEKYPNMLKKAYSFRSSEVNGLSRGEFDNKGNAIIFSFGETKNGKKPTVSINRNTGLVNYNGTILGYFKSIDNSFKGLSSIYIKRGNHFFRVYSDGTIAVRDTDNNYRGKDTKSLYGGWVSDSLGRLNYHYIGSVNDLDTVKKYLNSQDIRYLDRTNMFGIGSDNPTYNYNETTSQRKGGRLLRKINNPIDAFRFRRGGKF